MFVFISHANKDKPRIRPIVEAFIEEGIKVWLDKPSVLGFSKAEIDAHFYRLHADGKWEDEIDDAKREAACILVCWSKRAEGDDALKRHPVWFEEASYGRAEKKLVACAIDDVDPGKLPLTYSLHHVSDVRNETDLALVISDVRRKMHEFNAARNKQRIESDTRRSPLAPYLVNRTKQEEDIEAALEEACQKGGVRPFFILGPENECLDQFLDRLKDHTSRQCLDNGSCWHGISVEWPREDARRFTDVFVRRMAKSLGRRSSASVTGIARELANLSMPIAVISRIRAEDWQGDEIKRIDTWLKFWRDVAGEAGHRSVLPLLAIKLPKAKPGWKDVPSSGWFNAKGKKNKQIWDALIKIKKDFDALSIGLPPILNPVPRSDSDYWLAEYFSAGEKDYAAAEKIIKALYAPSANARHGVPHEEFADKTRPLFQGAATG